MIDADAALTFLNFVEQRHRAWERRTAGLPQETWTDDPVVAAKKFCNVYRVLDYGSQFVLKDLIDPFIDERDQLFRLFLYRHTGRIEAWQYLPVVLGGYPGVPELEETRAAWHTYRGQATMGRRGSGGGRFVVAGPARLFKRPVFTGAYLVFPQSTVPGTDKLDSILDLAKRLFDPASEDDIVPDFLRAASQAQRFRVLRRNKGVADFMSMQILTDWGYTPHCGEDRENEFVVPGPGAKKGAAELGVPAEEAIKWGTASLHSSGTVRLDGRLPSYMDVQNCLCEFSKYVRYAAKSLPAKPYRPAHPGLKEYVLPEHWNI